MSHSKKHPTQELHQPGEDMAEHSIEHPAHSERHPPSHPQPETTRPSMMKNYRDFTDDQETFLNSCMKSGAILAEGLEDIGRHVGALTQELIEMNIEASKAIMAARTLQDLINFQSEWIRQSLGTALAHSSKLSKLSVNVAHEARAPIQSCFSTALKKNRADADHRAHHPHPHDSRAA